MSPRPYSSESRAALAAVTRRRILAEDDRLLRQNGYAATTLAQIAQAAGVSVQSVYNLVGGKGELLKAVYDVALAGDDAPVPMAQRPLVQAMIAAKDARQLLGLYAQLAREIGERVQPLVTVVLSQASSGDSQLADFAETIERERGIGAAATARQLASKTWLRDGVDEQQAADILWALTAPELAQRLVHQRSWGWDRYQRWLGQTMGDALTSTRRR